MLLSLIAGIPLMLLCLVFQAVFIVICVREYGARVSRVEAFDRVGYQMTLLALVMFLMLLSNFLQMMAWALLFVLLGEFDSYPLALYHSAVNFATLGYGDIVLSEKWRLLGPLEAANGILMFGVSTSMMTAAIMDLMQRNAARKRAG